MPTDRQATTEAQAGYAYGTQETLEGTMAMGSSNPGQLLAGFSASPVFAGEIPLWETYAVDVMRGTGDIIASPDFRFHNVNGDGASPSRTYSENSPPAFTDVAANNTGEGGWPAGAFIPNIASPTGESTDPSALPESPYQPTIDNQNAGYGVSSLDSGATAPFDASALQGATADPLGAAAATYTLGEWLTG
tara:strand:+ start:236 stop:808 length:573 start_codon:yes stop_codon:yes gene_type:complete